MVDMGNRFVTERYKKTNKPGWCFMWSSAHEGKWWKRQMNKARRRAWKAGIEGVPKNRYESFCNWKGW